MKIVRCLFFPVILLSALSCATVYEVGEVFETQNIDKIEVGKTHQTDIVSMFGEPWRQGLSNGKDVFIYSHEKVIFRQDDSVDRQGNTLVIEFDEDDIVTNYYLNIPGKEAPLFGYLMHKRNMEKQQENVQHNQTATLHIHSSNSR